MTEELKQEEKCCKCECKELLAKLAIITAGSFIGCLLALCVFNTFANPQLPPPPAKPAIQQHHFQQPPTDGRFDKHGKFHPYMNKSEGFKKHHQKDFKKDFKKNRPDKPENK